MQQWRTEDANIVNIKSLEREDGQERDERDSNRISRLPAELLVDIEAVDCCTSKGNDKGFRQPPKASNDHR